MAPETRSPPPDLTLLQRLEDKPYAFGFFQAVRKLENLFRDKPRIGRSLHAREDAIRFGQNPFVIFGPTQLQDFKAQPQGRPPRLSSYFFGLFGPHGPMPLHFTLHAQERQDRANDHTLSRFLDVFHHRMTSLFYRAWANSRPVVQFDRRDDDRFRSYVGAAFGLGQPGLTNRDAVPDLVRLHFAGLLAGQTRHPDGLRAILEGFFRIPVRIEEFVGAWLEIPDCDRWRLGNDSDQGLGVSLTLGNRVWGRHQKFRIVLGPLSFEDYERMLPGGRSLERLVPLVRSYIGDELIWDTNLILKASDVPRLTLGKSGRLGWTTWLHPRRSTKDADDLKLNPLMLPT